MIIVLHPFTGDIMTLPPLMPLLKSYQAMVPRSKRYRYAPLNFVASLSVSADGTAAVMIVHLDMPHVFFSTTNDKEWSVSNWNLAHLSVPISFQGKLYILAPPAKRSSGKLILLVDPPRHEHAVMPSSLMPPTWIATCPTDKYSNPFSLAECDSEILVICLEDNKMSYTDKLVVYKLEDLAMDKVTPVTSIGGNTLLISKRLGATKTIMWSSQGVWLSLAGPCLPLWAILLYVFVTVILGTTTSVQVDGRRYLADVLIIPTACQVVALVA
jgi:hypothetical protein